MTTQIQAAMIARVISTKMPAAVTRMRFCLSGSSQESLTLQYRYGVNMMSMPPIS